MKLNEQKEERQRIVSEVRKDELRAIKEGKAPYFPKKSVIKEKVCSAVTCKIMPYMRQGKSRHAALYGSIRVMPLY